MFWSELNAFLANTLNHRTFGSMCFISKTDTG